MTCEKFYELKYAHAEDEHYVIFARFIQFSHRDLIIEMFTGLDIIKN